MANVEHIRGELNTGVSDLQLAPYEKLGEEMQDGLNPGDAIDRLGLSFDDAIRSIGVALQFLNRVDSVRQKSLEKLGGYDQYTPDTVRPNRYVSDTVPIGQIYLWPAQKK